MLFFGLLLSIYLAPTQGLPHNTGIRTAGALSANLDTIDNQSATVSWIANTLTTTKYTITIPTAHRATDTSSKAFSSVYSTSLEKGGRPSSPPFETSSVPTSGPINLASTVTSAVIPSHIPDVIPTASDVFAPIATDAPPPQIKTRSDHPASPSKIVGQTKPPQTNKFYANFFLGDQNFQTWTQPYALSWAKGAGSAISWGIGILHIERDKFAYDAGKPCRFFAAPVGTSSIILSATELGAGMELTVDTLEAQSANINLARGPGEPHLISFPVVQGMGFITAIYSNAIPLLQSNVGFKTVVFGNSLPGNLTHKYRVTLLDSTSWLIYITPRSGSGAPSFSLKNSNTIEGPSGFNGHIQVAKKPKSLKAEEIYDKHAGSYPTGAEIKASVDGKSGTYHIFWTKAGLSDPELLMFALPHHVSSFNDDTRARMTEIQLMSISKGMAVAVSGNHFTMVEGNLPVDVGFAPWSPDYPGEHLSISGEAKDLIGSVAEVELNENITDQTSKNSMYYSGKGLAKFASIVWILNEIGANLTMVTAGLDLLKGNFSVFLKNEQQYPLVYDAVWKGIVSEGAYITGQATEDFGNTFYNDHHFHYCYFVYAAAVIASLDPSWLGDGPKSNKAWVNTLIRDYANPVQNDPFFPFSRSFDWYHGHSWAKGIFASGDGKDQESSSEDAFSLYAIKMWGKVIGDSNMEARSNLQLAILARSLHNYFLLESSNQNQPPCFIENKVTGILFENKIDHQTYFGPEAEKVEGIHMIPLSPISGYIRRKNFVAEEWSKYFADGKVNAIAGGWRGILMANYALIQPKESYNFFADPNFNIDDLDGGASRTWYLAFSAGLGGALK